MKIYLKEDLTEVIYEHEGNFYPFRGVDVDLLPIGTDATDWWLYCPYQVNEYNAINWDDYREVSPEELTEIIKDMQ